MSETEKHVPDNGHTTPPTAITPYDPSRVKHGGVVANNPPAARRGRKVPKRSRWTRV
jgi:hypothetical protein